MRKSRFTEEQMVQILREADRTPVAEVAKKHGVAEQTISVWRQRFGRLEPADVKQLRHLEQENGRLKKLVAERDLEIEVLKGWSAKTGKHVGAAPSGRVCHVTRSVEPACLSAAAGRAIAGPKKSGRSN